jgi:membrane protein YdbS with pleckstrin-like domain
MRNALIAIAVAAVLIVALLRGAAASYGIWRAFHDSGYPWWIQVPSAVALVALFWMLIKRYKRGRFDGPF